MNLPEHTRMLIMTVKILVAVNKLRNESGKIGISNPSSKASSNILVRRRA